MIVKKRPKKPYENQWDDPYSVKDLLEEKRTELSQLNALLRVVSKNATIGDEPISKRDELKRQIKHLEREIRSLQRKL